AYTGTRVVPRTDGRLPYKWWRRYTDLYRSHLYSHAQDVHGLCPELMVGYRTSGGAATLTCTDHTCILMHKMYCRPTQVHGLCPELMVGYRTSGGAATLTCTVHTCILMHKMYCRPTQVHGLCPELMVGYRTSGGAATLTCTVHTCILMHKMYCRPTQVHGLCPELMVRYRTSGGAAILTCTVHTCILMHKMYCRPTQVHGLCPEPMVGYRTSGGAATLTCTVHTCILMHKMYCRPTQVHGLCPELMVGYRTSGGAATLTCTVHTCILMHKMYCRPTQYERFLEVHMRHLKTRADDHVYNADGTDFGKLYDNAISLWSAWEAPRRPHNGTLSMNSSRGGAPPKFKLSKLTRSRVWTKEASADLSDRLWRKAGGRRGPSLMTAWEAVRPPHNGKLSMNSGRGGAPLKFKLSKLTRSRVWTKEASADLSDRLWRKAGGRRGPSLMTEKKIWCSDKGGEIIGHIGSSKKSRKQATQESWPEFICGQFRKGERQPELGGPSNLLS
ncbi:hypothetical protein J6590_012134, partial [Homalodisca vitripennis]